MGSTTERVPHGEHSMKKSSWGAQQEEILVGSTAGRDPHGEHNRKRSSWGAQQEEFMSHIDKERDKKSDKLFLIVSKALLYKLFIKLIAATKTEILFYLLVVLN
ncbi:hypothetical protein Bpfe_011314 [Biomphalaria pfeifferi]|uniref:Uncharacterized protein n=1 Tax=Biomphalaria pfeifferi TaxID=112525 RepID=A0AAD8FCX8_BIOPF|nr:hypothetical protein Bpfe_011314 [Biomphalaria pfeifferi]